MYIADTLSRAYQTSDATSSNIEDAQQLRVHSITEVLPKIQQASASDPTLQAVSQRGWPSHKARVPPLAQQFWQVRDEVYIEHGLVFVGDRVVIPESL